MACVPVASAEVASDAVPLTSAAVLSAVFPSMKRIFPVGAAEPEVTAELKVTTPCSIVVFMSDVSVIVGIPFDAVPLSGRAAEIPPSAMMFMMPARNP